jgi:ADP-ribosylglycohydrolase
MATTTLDTTRLYRHALACLLGGLIGDAMGAPTEGKDYAEIEAQFGWVDDFTGDGTDDTVMKHLVAEALIRTNGYATLDDWAAVWLDNWEAIFGPKQGRFFISVLHTAHKLRRHATPRMAALGNMPSSSSAMAISPVGIVNACNPRAAAQQAYNLAGLIHSYDVAFCTDGAAAMAAAVAEALRLNATVDSILTAAQDAILPTSGAEMRARIAAAPHLAGEMGEFRAFRAAIYADRKRWFFPLICDARETIPLTLAIFYLAQGDVVRCATYGANLGRDADTIASMATALAGAWQGLEGIPTSWRERVLRSVLLDQEALAMRLVETARDKAAREAAARAELEGLL